MAAEDEGKTEEPTAKKLTQARESGNVPKSTDLGSAVVILAAAATLAIFGGQTGAKIGRIMTGSFNRISTFEDLPGSFVHLFVDAIPTLLWILLPLVGTLAVVSVLIQLLQTGFLFSTKALEPNFTKVFKLAGLKRMFSKETWVEMLKSLAKMAMVALVGYHVVSRHYREYLQAADQETGQILTLIGAITIEVLWKCGLLLVLVGVFDYWWQRHRWKDKLKMTKQEVKDEMKSAEGDPQIKNKIKRMRQEMHRTMIVHEIPKATVVITNPTFIAIALRYQQGVDTAPVVVAKGKRLMAERIRDMANDNHIPLVEDKPLARSLYEVAEVGNPIPPEYFAAVAEILAYVFGLKGQAPQSTAA